MNLRNIFSAQLLIGFLVVVGLTACEEEEGLVIIDDSLMVLSATLNGEPLTDGLSELPRDVEVVLVFSHSLNTANVQNGISLSGPGGGVPLDISFSNSNSTVTIRPSSILDFESTYSLVVAPGTYGAEERSLNNEFTATFTTAPFVPANVTLSADVLEIGEAGGVATVTVTLSMPIELDVDITLALAGSASADADYSATATMLQIPSGETEATLTLSAQLDGQVEGTETIEVSIASVTNAEELNPQLLSINLLDADLDSNGDGTPDQGFIINEVLFDPPGGDAGDANGDGTRSPSEDEFIEFVNDSDLEVDLSGFTLFDANRLETMEPRHVFPEGTIIPPGGVFVLFGGGTPAGDFGDAIVAVTTTGNMNLTNSDDVITILDPDGNVFLTFDTQGEGAGISFGEDQSVTRNPEINGDFILHTMVNAELDYSPGKRADGSNFGGGSVDPGQGLIINEVLFDPPADLPGDANGDGMRSASEDEFIEFYNDSDASVDISGYRLFDARNLETLEPRHVFPEGTIIPARSVYVLFGGGTPMGTFGGAQVGTSTTGNMNLSNGGDVITILDTNGEVFLVFDTDVDGAGIGFGEDQSVSRNPDISGSFDLHTNANAALLFSPGTKVDGSEF